MARWTWNVDGLSFGFNRPFTTLNVRAQINNTFIHNTLNCDNKVQSGMAQRSFTIRHKLFIFNTDRANRHQPNMIHMFHLVLFPFYKRFIVHSDGRIKRLEMLDMVRPQMKINCQSQYSEWHFNISC